MVSKFGNFLTDVGFLVRELSENVMTFFKKKEKLNVFALKINWESRGQICEVGKSSSSLFPVSYFG